MDEPTQYCTAKDLTTYRLVDRNGRVLREFAADPMIRSPFIMDGIRYSCPNFSFVRNLDNPDASFYEATVSQH